MGMATSRAWRSESVLSVVVLSRVIRCGEKILVYAV